MAVFPLRKSEPALSGFGDAVLADANAALASLDLSAEREEVEELTREIARTRRAIEDGNARLAKVRADLGAMSGPNGRAVADMLLAGQESADVLAAAGRNKAELEEERAALMEAITVLRRRSDDAERQIVQIHRQARHRVHDCLVPLVEALEQDIRTAAQQVVDSFTMLRAVALATDRNIEGARQGEKAVAALLGPPGLVARPKRLDVPVSIQGLFEGLSEQGAALPNIVFASVPAPV